MTLISEYQHYVNNKKLSQAGFSTTYFTQQVIDLSNSGIDIVRLMCGAIGQSAETGEFLAEVLKPTSPKLVDELGDVLFYTMVSAQALGINLCDIQDANLRTTFVNAAIEVTTDMNLLECTQQLVIITSEFLDIVKKVIFQGKPITTVIRNELFFKLSFQYAIVYKIATIFGLPLEYVILCNQNKLNKRYKGEFTVEESEKKSN